MPQETFAVCLGRQIGSGGHTIALEIAKKLNLHFYDNDLIHLAAAECGFNKELFEHKDEERTYLRSFFTNFIPFIGQSDFYRNQVDEESLFAILSQTIKELSEQYNSIFVGRCAEYILRHKPKMTSIFVCADMPDRISRVSNDQHITPEAARKMILANDKRRASFHNFYSEKHWGEADTYDLCINSSKLGMEGTVDFIIDFIQQRIK